jgi:hypothetical protein
MPGSQTREITMLTRMKLAGTALTLGILFFAQGTNAEPSARETIEHVLGLLASAGQTLQRDPVSPDDKQRGLGQIRDAMDLLVRLKENLKEN